MSRKASLVMRAVLQLHDHVFHALAVNEEGADVAERVLLQGVWARLHVSLISHPSGPAETDRARNLATETEANRGDDIRDFFGIKARRRRSSVDLASILSVHRTNYCHDVVNFK